MGKRLRKIGADWAETVDASSGRTYYVNMKTKKTRWDKPSEDELKWVHRPPRCALRLGC